MAMRQDDKKKKAVVLLSGGLDSATVLAWAARRGGFECHALSFKYGQRHGSAELAASRKLAAAWGAAEHRIVTIDLSAASGFGHSALTDSIQVPKDRVDHGEIPVTYVPARNTIFLSFALGYAETIGSYDIFIGVNAIDYSGYPDCRPEFIETFQKLANLATAAGVEHKGRFTIHSPLVHMNKAEIIRAGLEMGVDYSMTHSCYDPDESGRACGHCDSCRIRLAGFAAAGAKDPVQYR